MNIVDLAVISSRERKYGANDNIDFGIMYELHRNEENINDLIITQKIGIDSVKKKWPMFSIEYVSEIKMTYDVIKEICIIYSLAC